MHGASKQCFVAAPFCEGSMDNSEEVFALTPELKWLLQRPFGFDARQTMGSGLSLLGNVVGSLLLVLGLLLIKRCLLPCVTLFILEEDLQPLKMVLMVKHP